MKCSNADHDDSVFPEMSQRRHARHAADQDIDATTSARFDALNIQNQSIKFIEMTPHGNPDMPCEGMARPIFRAMLQRTAHRSVFHSGKHFNRSNGSAAPHSRFE
ncbi:hypothetical protein [Burkholderia stagnalis]